MFSSICLPHRVLFGEAYMFALEDVLKLPLEGRAERINRVTSLLYHADSWLIWFGMRGVDRYSPCIFVIVLGHGCSLVLGLRDAVIEEQLFTIF